MQRKKAMPDPPPAAARRQAAPGGAFDGAAAAAALPEMPGVYLFRDAQGRLLYVGKAANLRRRVASYFDRRDKQPRLARLREQTQFIDYQRTASAAEALLLENEWIKTHRPRYNIRLRDDKSYPFIRVDGTGAFPRLSFHRGARRPPDVYFGPYVNAQAVRQTLDTLFRVFRLRQCPDSVFAHRTRPCLQYQIGRCSAPCVGLIDAAAYRRDLEQAERWLAGQSAPVHEELNGLMAAAAAQHDYEQAALWRDRIRTLAAMQEKTAIAGQRGDMDVIALAGERGMYAAAVQSVRDGRNQGIASWLLQHTADYTAAEVLAAIVGQYYVDRVPPRDILLDRRPAEPALWSEALARRAGHQVRLVWRPRAERARLVALAASAAEQTLTEHFSRLAGGEQALDAVQKRLALPVPPRRIECFDTSHLGGTEMVAACTVALDGDLARAEYRRFHLRQTQPGDDYGALAEVLGRRYRGGGENRPDLIVIDGGKGQLAAAGEVLAGCGLGDIPLLGLAKGPSRRTVDEAWWIAGRGIWRPDAAEGATDPGTRLIRRLRDEAHRFAITGQRISRHKSRNRSQLEEIPGIGPRRRRELLTHFGGLDGVRQASIDQLAAVPGLSRPLAERIFQSLRR